MNSPRLSKNSYSLQEFNKTTPEYQSALEKNDYKKKLTHIKQEPKKTDLIQLNLKNTDQETEQERLFGLQLSF